MKPIHHLLILGLIFCVFTIGNATTLVNIQSVKIAKGYSAEFLFDLEEGDNFNVTYKIIDGAGNSDDLKVYLFDLNQLEETRLKEFTSRSDYSRIPQTGLYKLVFDYVGGGSRLPWKGSKSIVLSVKAESLNTLEIQSGESRQILRISNLPLDANKDAPFRVVYALEEGDKLYISSGDPKASFVKLNVIQLGLNKFLNSVSTIEIMKDGYYTFDLYLEENNEATGIYQTLASLLSNDDVNFSDLIITREKAMKSSFSYNQAQGNMYTTGSTGSTPGGNAQEEEAIDPMANYAKLLDEMKNSSNSAADNQTAMMELMAEQMRIMEEATKSRAQVEITATNRPYIKYNLDPSGNFADNVDETSANRECLPLNLKGGGMHNVWFYWIAVGEKAEEAFDLETNKYASFNNKNIIQEKAKYLYYSQSGEPQKAGANPPLPRDSDPNYKGFFGEDVEYAIVDSHNSDKFLKGERYRKMNSSNYKYVTTDEGISFIPPTPDAEYFLCICNNNKNTAISVFFTYFTIGVTTIEY